MQAIKIFKIRKEERCATILCCLVFCLLNALNVVRYYGQFSGVSKVFAWRFMKEWQLAGFDCWTYSVMTDWNSGYNIYRHPLLAYFVWPFTKLNECLMVLTGQNCAIVITAVLLVLFATYSFVFLSRIFCEVIGTTRKEAYILSTLNFSFAYVTLSIIAPDHFGVSMFCLLLTLYLSGRISQKDKALNWWQTIVLFVVTAGISLNNGLKVFLAAMFTRRKRFFKLGYLIVAVILPAALMWGGARLSYHVINDPINTAYQEKKKVLDKQYTAELRQKVIDSLGVKDSAAIERMVKAKKRQAALAKYKRDHSTMAAKNTGTPLARGEFSSWTDVSTNRCDVAIENLFGEGIMIHQDYLLGDVLINRPVIVHYRNWFNYIVEGILVLLFIGGIWYGRRSLFMWTAMSFFLMDMALHMGLGFGINEISIMSAHYLYVLPICMAYLLIRLDEKWRKRMTLGLGVIAAYLIVWNVTLLVEYLYM